METNHKFEEKLIRTPSGIPGLDEMTEGGLPIPSTMLIVGSAGTGKTTFGLQFLFEGARRGEQGIYFTTLSEPPQWLLRFTSTFKFVYLNKKYLDKEIKYVDLGKLLMRKETPKTILTAIEKEIADTLPQRIVIDPITIVKDRLRGDYRPFVFELSARLKNWQAVTMLTGEVMPDEPYPIELAYTADSIILLLNIEEERRRTRYLEILKMRGTEHLTGKQSFTISKNGITVIPGLK